MQLRKDSQRSQQSLWEVALQENSTAGVNTVLQLPQCRGQTVHVVPTPQPGLCANDESILVPWNTVLICKSSQKGAQQSASEPGPLSGGDTIVEITVSHKATKEESRTTLELINGR